ncbi:twin-arginine translocation signal domain-containing protein [Halorussus halophilus]|uniref:twin-arginine translocation signal domain-containing protein n=1 Tax=Halorussus halophilus TaxID=2650975 RepID=UPI001300D6A0|nr:twin-arginine translocation signal domain-containing protein [Halorussus halophilus]
MSMGRGSSERTVSRRGFLTGVGSVVGVVVVSGLVSSQQVDTSLPPGAVLFDLNDDGSFDAEVTAGSDSVRDDAHPNPVHVTSGGNSTVDYAASVVEPDGELRLGDVQQLSYDYYEGPNNAGPAPDDTFLVVENGDGRHGMYLSFDADAPSEQWQTHDVAARIRGDTEGTSGWFEYTAVEGGDDRNFDNVVERFGEDARLVRVGIGRGDAVEPATLDVFYDNLRINDATREFPTSISKRVAGLDGPNSYIFG